jgi:hypothetical protein
MYIFKCVVWVSVSSKNHGKKLPQNFPAETEIHKIDTWTVVTGVAA